MKNMICEISGVLNALMRRGVIIPARWMVAAIFLSAPFYLGAGTHNFSNVSVGYWAVRANGFEHYIMEGETWTFEGEGELQFWGEGGDTWVTNMTLGSGAFCWELRGLPWEVVAVDCVEPELEVLLLPVGIQCHANFMAVWRTWPVFYSGWGKVK